MTSNICATNLHATDNGQEFVKEDIQDSQYCIPVSGTTKYVSSIPHSDSGLKRDFIAFTKMYHNEKNPRLKKRMRELITDCLNQSGPFDFRLDTFIQTLLQSSNQNRLGDAIDVIKNLDQEKLLQFANNNIGSGYRYDNERYWYVLFLSLSKSGERFSFEWILKHREKSMEGFVDGMEAIHTPQAREELSNALQDDIQILKSYEKSWITEALSQWDSAESSQQ